MSEKFEKIVNFRPAYDKRNTDSSKNYGVHCVDMFMILKGTKGAIVFTVFTGWYLPNTIDWWKSRNLATLESVKGWGADIGYHSKKPLSEYQHENAPSTEHCEYCDGQPCWYDGSGLAAQELFQKFVAQGEEVVWRTLEDWYYSEFGGRPEEPALNGNNESERRGALTGTKDVVTGDVLKPASPSPKTQTEGKTQ